MVDVMGIALIEHLTQNSKESIITHSTLEENGSLPLDYLFRDFSQMPKLEKHALTLCKGAVLDIGCGAGSHALYLQNKGLKVTALDKSKGAIEVCEKRGLQSTICTNILDYSEEKFDTLLLLMNGIGIAGSLEQLPNYLNHFRTLLQPNGQILLDSSNIIYMFDADEDGGYWIPGDTDYYGEVKFTMEYKTYKSDTFPWLYIDFETLERVALYCGFACEKIMEGEHYDYLAKLSLLA
ncbi:SAM-dependent methyltransferase [Croceivirga radicis]|uniref:SAM-dependent methyltransferase n=1 Tax=Croceivirga radicis TaxID=1929488 RepID=A0A1V6LPX4_9FLAO|nr:class I SAM-dependent methyltransferase [Croceivirga radicis]OQD42250.1 SAM-dependent methyltransferase [Croceivirga radicis]